MLITLIIYKGYGQLVINWRICTTRMLIIYKGCGELVLN